MSPQVAIVAGASGALGHAMTKTLAVSGLTVVAVDRNERGLPELPDGVRREVADTTDPEVVTPLIDRIGAEVGPLAVLVNTISAFRPADALTTTPEIDVNLGTALWLSQAVAHLTRILDIELRLRSPGSPSPSSSSEIGHARKRSPPSSRSCSPSVC